jgi:putative hydroxymethylpyrimidine transport system substrate-binding protein
MKHALATLALTLFATHALAQDKMTVMLDWFINPDHGPIILAQELGYFADAGLEVELVTPADPNDPPRMVAAGRVDLAVSYQPELHLNRREGLDLVRVGTLIETPLTCLVVRADGPVRAIGLAYGAQELPPLPVEPTDQPLDCIVTEGGVIRPLP